MIDDYEGNDFKDWKFKLDPEIEQRIIRNTEAAVVRQAQFDAKALAELTAAEQYQTDLEKL